METPKERRTVKRLVTIGALHSRQSLQQMSQRGVAVLRPQLREPSLRLRSMLLCAKAPVGWPQ